MTAAESVILLAYVPLFDPLDGLQPWWYLLCVPLVVLTSMAWKALRARSMTRYWRKVTIMSIQVIAGMIALAAVLFILVQFGIPALPAE